MSSGSKPRVNLRSTAVKRIMQEAAELADPDEADFVAGPLESDIFEWHCTLRGVPGSEFEGGLYHLRILLPPTYPMSAPDIMLMTPNGRFELGKKICIDGLTSFHAGSWQPAWGVRTAILGLRSFWTQTGADALAAIGALDYSKEERRRLARLSHDWECPTCGVKNKDLLKPEAGKKGSKTREDELKSSSAPPAADRNAPNHHDDVSTPGAVADRPKEEQAPSSGGEQSRAETSNDDSSLPQAQTSSVTPPDTRSTYGSTATESMTDTPLPADNVGSTRPSDVPAGTSASTPSATADSLRQRRPHGVPPDSLESPSAMSGTTPPPARAAAPVQNVAIPLVAQDLISPDPPSRRKPLLWIDIGIFVLSSLLFVFIARRMARSGPLDDLDQA